MSSLLEQAVLDWIVENADLIRSQAAYISDRRDELLEEEPQEFHDDINQEYKEAIENIVKREIQTNFQVDPETVSIVLQDHNILEYL